MGKTWYSSRKLLCCVVAAIMSLPIFAAMLRSPRHRSSAKLLCCGQRFGPTKATPKSWSFCSENSPMWCMFTTRFRSSHPRYLKRARMRVSRLCRRSTTIACYALRQISIATARHANSASPEAFGAQFATVVIGSHELVPPRSQPCWRTTVVEARGQNRWIATSR